MFRRIVLPSPSAVNSLGRMDSLLLAFEGEDITILRQVWRHTYTMAMCQNTWSGDNHTMAVCQNTWSGDTHTQWQCVRILGLETLTQWQCVRILGLETHIHNGNVSEYLVWRHSHNGSVSEYLQLQSERRKQLTANKCLCFLPVIQDEYSGWSGHCQLN